MALSTASSYTMEQVANVATAPLWFQVFVFRDRGLAEYLVRRAEKAGFRGLVVTVTSVAMPRVIVPALDAAGLAPPLKVFDGLDRPNLPTLGTLISSLDQTLSWRDLA